MSLSPTSSRGSSTAGAATLISTTVLAVDGTFDIQSISQSYNHLQLVWMIRSARAAQDSDSVMIRFNNDSGANYDRVTFGGTQATGQTSGYLCDVQAANIAAGRFGGGSAIIPGYTSTTWDKDVVSTYEGTGSGTLITGNGIVSRWNSTAAVTRIQLISNNGANLLTGSTVWLYGLT